MPYNTRIAQAWADWYLTKHPVAITLTFNYKTNGKVQPSALNPKLSIFKNKIDRVRGGCRHKKKLLPAYCYVLSPEKFDCGNPHYHGLIELPPDLVAKYGREETIALLTKLWKETVPSGTICIKEIFDANGWVKYSSKECLLWSDDAYASFPS